jgi:hypothetical protein
MSSMHLSKTDQHFTPPYVADLAREHCGGFDLDPCSSEKVNDWSVRAKNIFSEDGIKQLKELPKGDLMVWCNPPSTYPGECLDWLKVLSEARSHGQIKAFYFLFFNRENLGKAVEGLSQAFHVHFTNRLKYWSWNEVTGRFQEGQWGKVKGERRWTNSPTHPSSLYYFPPVGLSREKLNQDADLFEEIWGMEGNVIIPRIK